LNSKLFAATAMIGSVFLDFSLLLSSHAQFNSETHPLIPRYL
jgi:hypothetical protein